VVPDGVVVDERDGQQRRKLWIFETFARCRSTRMAAVILGSNSLSEWTTCEHPPATRADCSIRDRAATSPVVA
jgi:hypothetical protein